MKGKITAILSILLSLYVLEAEGQCSIDSVSIEVSDCKNGLSDVWINIAHGGNDSTQFSVKGNGTDYGNFSYQDLPVNIGPIKIDQEKFYEFVIQDLQPDSCSVALDYGYINCIEDSCTIGILTAINLDSCVVEGSFTVEIDMKAENVNHVDLYIDGEFYDYLPVTNFPATVSIANNGLDRHSIKVLANDQSNCFASVELLSPQCDDCGISNLYTRVIECDDTSFYIRLGLDHFGPHSEYFNVYGNGRGYGLFRYSELPVVLGPFQSGAKERLEFIVYDSIYNDCQLEASVDGTPCRSNCTIGDLNTEVVECDSGFFSLNVDFEYSGGVSDSFKLKGNGKFYGIYGYSQLPITLSGLVADGVTHYEFAVIDQEGKCSNYIDLGTVDCYCLWSDIVLDPGDCTSDSTYSLVINFMPGNVDSFTLYTQDVRLGSYSVQSLPLRLENFPASGKKSDELWMCAVLTNCCLRFEVESPDCVRDLCAITDLEASALECDGGQYKVLVDFDYNEHVSEKFIVKRNGEWVGEYSYADLPLKIGPFWSIDSSFMVLEICDAVNHDCHAEVEVLDPGCSNCNGKEIKVEVGECTSDSTYKIILNAELSGGFDFYVNGHFCGTFEGAQLPLTFEDFPASGGLFDYMKICFLDSNYCCQEQKIEAPVCARNTCSFENVRYELTDCTPNNIFYAWIIMDTIGTPDGTFIVQGDSMLLEFAYSELPVKIGPFPGGDEFYQFKIYDSDNPDCKKQLVLGRVVCPEQCNLEFGKIDIAECGPENLILLLDSLEGSYRAFDVYFGDEYLGYHNAEELPLRLKAKIPADKNEVLVRICISDNTTCCAEKLLDISECNPASECELRDLRIDTFECKNDSLYVNLNFITNIADSASFILKINGVESQEFLSTELPLHVGPLFSGSDQRYVIVVRSQGDDDCGGELILEGVHCPASNVEQGVRLLILESANFTNYMKVPDFISERSTFQLVDLSGRVLYQMEFSADTRRALIQIPVDVAGLYIVKIRSRDGQQYLSKIIIP